MTTIACINTDEWNGNGALSKLIISGIRGGYARVRVAMIVHACVQHNYTVTVLCPGDTYIEGAGPGTRPENEQREKFCCSYGLDRVRAAEFSA